MTIEELKNNLIYYSVPIIMLMVASFCAGVIWISFQYPTISTEENWLECNKEAWRICDSDGRAEFYDYLLEYTDYGASEDAPVLNKFKEIINNGCYKEVAELCELATVAN